MRHIDQMWSLRTISSRQFGINFLKNRYEPLTKVEGTQIDKRIEFKVNHEQQEKASNRLIVSTLLGTIGAFVWEGFMYKEGKPEKAKQVRHSWFQSDNCNA